MTNEKEFKECLTILESTRQHHKESIKFWADKGGFIEFINSEERYWSTGQVGSALITWDHQQAKIDALQKEIELLKESKGVRCD